MYIFGCPLLTGYIECETTQNFPGTCLQSPVKSGLELNFERSFTDTIQIIRSVQRQRLILAPSLSLFIPQMV